MHQPILKRIWGEATAVLVRTRRIDWVDLLIAIGIAGLLFGLISLAREWRSELQPSVEIDLSPWALPVYTLFSLARGLLAYAVSLAFTLLYGYWAAKDRVAERVLLPLLDILQSIPVLAFMPGLVLALVAAFPFSNTGLELAAVLMIFTGQAWNMTFSFYHSLRTVPAVYGEVARVFRFSWWQRLKWIELPYATIGLVWNSMMSMAGGWFFLMINEAFRLGEKDFRLPGIGSYMSVAVERGRMDAMLWAIAAMVAMIVLVDQVLWRPVVVWAQKFRLEESGQSEAVSSWFLDRLRRSHILAATVRGIARLRRSVRPVPAVRGARSGEQNRVDTHEPGYGQQPGGQPAMMVSSGRAREPDGSRRSRSLGPRRRWVTGFSLALLLIVLLVLAQGAARLVGLLASVSWFEWHETLVAAAGTLARVLAATALGTLWTLPAGLAIGLSPRVSRVCQPVVQVVASFPAPMLFPLVISALKWAGVSLGWGSILLMLLGTQWYILFNTIAGAMAIPADLTEAARSYRMSLWHRFWTLYLPAVFPNLVTGWVTAAGGAWNASIVAEYVTFKGEVLQTRGLGAQISFSAASANYSLLAASVLVMSALVVVFNRTVWRQCYRVAEERYSLNK